MAELGETFHLSAATNGPAIDDRDLRGGDGCRYCGCRFRVLQKSLLGTADVEYRHCLGVRGLLL
jgi:hypothetical protein